MGHLYCVLYTPVPVAESKNDVIYINFENQGKFITAERLPSVTSTPRSESNRHGRKSRSTVNPRDVERYLSLPVSRATLSYEKLNLKLTRAILWYMLQTTKMDR